MADQTALGKPLGGDLREGKVTLPVILLLQRTGPEVAAMVRKVIADGEVDDVTAHVVLALARVVGDQAVAQSGCSFLVDLLRERLQIQGAGTQRTNHFRIAVREEHAAARIERRDLF